MICAADDANRVINSNACMGIACGNAGHLIG